MVTALGVWTLIVPFLFVADLCFNGFYGSKTKLLALRHLRLLFHVLV